MKSETTKSLFQAGNIISAAVMITVNALANLLPIAGRRTGEISDLIPNLFVPAGITFSIWGPIYILITMFIIFQARDLFSKEKKDMPFLSGINWLLIINFIANACWIISWHYLQTALSVCFMIIILGTLIAAYQRLGIGTSKAPMSETICVRIPVSVYLGWICVATIANITAFLVTIGWDTAGLGEVFWTVALIIVAACIALAALVLRKDMALGLVVIWALAGIFIKRTSPGMPAVPEVSFTALISLLVVGAGMVFTLIRILSGRRQKSA
ncbi:MAG: hypothetical protein EHM28_01570 [Spirochaetaceae bacterium]|nr:MAG: hypothetical protein EHM28_01570 [Spirochaetaceae bacterium]